MKPETVFEIGSITKQFTAAGILLLLGFHERTDFGPLEMTVTRNGSVPHFA